MVKSFWACTYKQKGEVATISKDNRKDAINVCKNIKKGRVIKISPKAQHIVRRVIDLQADKIGNIIPITDIISGSKKQGVSKLKTEAIVMDMRKKGDIFERRPKIISKIY